MATYIKIDRAGNEIVVRNKQDADANRLSNLERTEEEQTKAAIKAATAIATEEAKRRLRSLRDRPAAYFISIGSPLGHLWWFMESEPVTNYGVQAGLLPGSNTRFIYATDYIVGYKRTTHLYCGDGSASIQIEHGLQAQQFLPSYTSFPYAGLGNTPSTTLARVAGTDASNFNGDDGSDILILPAGGDAFIVVFFAWTATVGFNVQIPVTSETETDQFGRVRATCTNPGEDTVITSFDRQEQITDTRRVFFCSKSTIREIEPPAAFATLLDLLLAREDQDYDYPTTFFAGTANFVVRSERPYYPQRWFNDSTGIAGPNTYGYTSGVYSTAVSETSAPAEVVEAWSERIGGLVQQVPANLRWIVENTSTGAYVPANASSGWQSLFNGNYAFEYGQWRTPNETPGYLDDEFDPTLYISQPKRRLALSPNRPTLDFPSNGSTYQLYSQLSVVWDWDNSAYCRRMLLALGFTSQDLTP